MHHSKTQRAALPLAFTALALLAISPAANALRNGTQLVGAAVPDWAVGNFSCEGTLITPRVVLTAAHCVGASSRYSFYHRKTGNLYNGNTAGNPGPIGPFGDVGMVMMDTLFGGSTEIQTAPIASYLEEMQAIEGSDDLSTSKTPLVAYGKDTASGNFSRHVRTADAHWDPLQNHLPVIPDGPKMVYRSAHIFRQLEPLRMAGIAPHNNYFNTNLVERLGLNLLSSEAIDRQVFIAAAIWALPLRERGGAPIYAGDSGGSFFLRLPDQTLRLFGVVSGTITHPRVSHHWPWVVQTLIERGLREDAVLLSQKVLGTGEWEANDRKGKVGQIYVYDNPFNGKVEYFRLASLGSDGRYWYFPTNQQDNEYWEYLGNALPDIEQATTPLHNWDDNDRQGTVGDLYIYNNPYSRQVEYFRLTALGADGRYWYFPTNQGNNEYWQYVGTDLPTRPLTLATNLK